jgi:hypothetical protein
MKPRFGCPYFCPCAYVFYQNCYVHLLCEACSVCDNGWVWLQGLQYWIRCSVIRHSDCTPALLRAWWWVACMIASQTSGRRDGRIWRVNLYVIDVTVVFLNIIMSPLIFQYEMRYYCTVSPLPLEQLDTGLILLKLRVVAAERISRMFQAASVITALFTRGDWTGI